MLSNSLSSQINDLIHILENSAINNISLSNNQQNDDDDDDDDGRLILKTAKGTIDYSPGDMLIRSSMMKSIRSNMNKFGGQFMETPVFELRSILMDKYGSDEKLIYDLSPQESEILSLRYDLTVPLARFVAQNRKNIKSPFKASRCGRVYRRDQPYMTRGRMREFWQCDFDIIRTSFPHNNTDLICDDSEIISLTIKQLIDLDFGDFYLLINNRKLLNSILDICCVPDNQIKLISSSIDKLDKKDWNYVKQEMCEKGLNSNICDKIRQFVIINGEPYDVLNKLKLNPDIIQYSKTNPTILETIKEFEILLMFLKSYNPEYLNYLRMDMSMVRGLDYYTGIIMEAQFSDDDARINYGSIAGGGRYDNLVSNLLNRRSNNPDNSDQKDNNQNQINQYPCVGSSIGFERIYCYLKSKLTSIPVGVSTNILICELCAKTGPQLGLYNERLKLLNYLRLSADINVNVEIMSKIRPSFRDQINYAEQREIKWMIIIGDDEIKNNTLNLRRLTLKNDIILTKDNKKGEIIEIQQTSKWPVFIVKSIDKPNKNWKLNKKQIKKVIQNNQEFDLQITIKRDELIDFFKKIY